MILGCETPRIFTPPRRELTPDTTDGFAAIAFAEEILGITLFPWQKWTLIHGLELNDDWTYRFRTVIVEVARQNGKTLILALLALWHIYAKGSRTVIATAQDLGKAEDSWAAAVEWAQSNEELNELIRKITLAHPKVFRVFNPQIGRECEYRVATASRRGGRGFSGDLILLDELREHQSWDSWSAVTKTMMARPRGQTWAFSNAADALGVVLRYQRALAHRALGWPDGDRDAQEPTIGELDPALAELFADFGDSLDVGWFEYSAPPKALRTDRAAWAQANPAKDHIALVENCVTERAIAHALRTDPVDVFDTEVMCRQVDTAGGGPFPDGAWAATGDDMATPATNARSVVCVEVSTTRNAAVITRAAMDDQGWPVVGVAEMVAGTDWVVTWLAQNRGYAGIAVRAGAGSPNLSLLADMIEAGLPVLGQGDGALGDVPGWKGAEVGAAFQQLYDRVRDRTIRHLSHPGLDTAACTAVIKMSPAGGWIVDPLKSPSDVCPLYAAAGAVWGLGYLPDDGPSIYAGPHGVDVLVV